MGPIQRADPKEHAVSRLVDSMRRAASENCDLIVYPELALTTFFPRWLIENQDELDSFFERTMPGPVTRPLFDAARELGIGFYLGFAELVSEENTTHHYNTSILVDPSGKVLSKYRKIHLPGHSEPDSSRTHQHMEKRYFEVGNVGFPVCRAWGGNIGMAICNDRRWPETYRILALKDVELTLIGYNTPVTDSLSDEDPSLRRFHNRLCMQAGAYQNSTWVVGVAKAGVEDGHALMGGSCIIAPTGEIVAEAVSDGDELLVADCDLDQCTYYKEHIFNFAAHRRPEHYGAIAAQAERAQPSIRYNFTDGSSS